MEGMEKVVQPWTPSLSQFHVVQCFFLLWPWVFLVSNPLEAQK